MRALVPVCVGLLMAQFAVEARGENFMVRLELQGRQFEGTPLAWDDDEVAFLARDGELLWFGPQEPRNFRKTAPQFQSYSPAEMRARLMAEFGRQFDVSGTGQYLVVHPAGKRDVWAQRFEDLFRSFVHYFTVRGLTPRQPDFPLVAVVFYNQQDFYRYAAQSGVRVGPGVLGFYSTTTNRILMFDPDGGRGSDNWQQAAETIIHEASHQTAFNTGVHSRFRPPPRWLAEGLGTMFEAPGVWNSALYPRQQDRLNAYRLDSFRRYAPARKQGWLSRAVSHDGAFERSPDEAYAEAWAITFFLAETRPRQYAEYLQKTAALPAFTAYKSPHRLQDFRDVFGGNLALLEAQLERFIAALP